MGDAITSLKKQIDINTSTVAQKRASDLVKWFQDSLTTQPWHAFHPDTFVKPADAVKDAATGENSIEKS